MSPTRVTPPCYAASVTAMPCHQRVSTPHATSASLPCHVSHHGEAPRKSTKPNPDPNHSSNPGSTADHGATGAWALPRPCERAGPACIPDANTGTVHRRVSCPLSLVPSSAISPEWVSTAPCNHDHIMAPCASTDGTSSLVRTRTSTHWHLNLLHALQQVLRNLYRHGEGRADECNPNSVNVVAVVCPRTPAL